MTTRCFGSIIFMCSRFRGPSRDHEGSKPIFSYRFSHTPSLLPGWLRTTNAPFFTVSAVRPHTQGRARSALPTALSGMEDFPPLFNTRIGATNGRTEKKSGFVPVRSAPNRLMKRTNETICRLTCTAADWVQQFSLSLPLSFYTTSDPKYA